MNIRDAAPDDFDNIWPIFQEIVASGETYAYPRDTTKEQAFTVPFLTYLISVFISLLGGLIFVSRTPRRALRGILERRRTARAAAAGGRAGKGID